MPDRYPEEALAELLLMKPVDPNADLIGFRYTHGPEEVEIVGTPEWCESGAYVTVRFPTGYETIKPAALMRRRKEQS
jgi:hypothetical protein